MIESFDIMARPNRQIPTFRHGHIQIKNVVGSAKPRIADSSSLINGSAIQTINHYANTPEKRCSCCGVEAPLAGGHVTTDIQEYGRKWFLTPLCAVCNNPYNQEWMGVRRGAVLISVVLKGRSRVVAE